MHLLRLRDVDTSAYPRVFRHSPMRAAVLACGGAAAAGVFAYVGSAQVGRPAFILAWYLAALLFAGVVLTRRFFVARLRPSNWLVRMGDTGLLVQFRSYLNYHLPPEDATVVSIPFGDIGAARLVRERATVSSQHEQTIQFRRFVELDLAGDVAPLATALEAESVRKAPRVKTWYGSGAILYQHYPVRMPTPPALQIEWAVVPRAETFLELLRPYTSIAVPAVVAQDFARTDGLSRAEQERRIRELDQRGQTIAAIELARRLYGYDLTTATAFVEGLRAGEKEPST